MSRSYLRARPRGLARPPAPVQTAAAQARACVPSKRPLCAAGAAPRASHRPPNLHAQPPAAPRQPSLPPEKIPQLAGAAPGGAAAAVLALLGLDRDRLRWAHLRRRPAPQFRPDASASARCEPSQLHTFSKDLLPSLHGLWGDARSGARQDAAASKNAAGLPPLLPPEQHNLNRWACARPRRACTRCSAPRRSGSAAARARRGSAG